MEIFQDGAFPNLEYHLFQVIWCVSALIRKCPILEYFHEIQFDEYNYAKT